MLTSVQYTLLTTSTTGSFVNARVRYDVKYDNIRGIAYNVELQSPVSPIDRQLQIVWKASIVNLIAGDLRLEYDILKRIYYQSRQTIKVESALYQLQEDLTMFLQTTNKTQVADIVIQDRRYPGYRLHTLTIWYDPELNLPVRRLNQDRGNQILDEFFYQSINQPIPENEFQLPKPAEAIADFDLYPEAPTLPRFEIVPDGQSPQYGVYVLTLIQEIKRFTIQNQWEYGPFATIILPWLTDMPVTIYKRASENVFPPLIATVETPNYPRTYFFITYDFLGYVVTGTSQTPFNLSDYNALPIQATMRLEEFVPLYQSPSDEKDFVIQNFVISLQSNDFFINAFDMGGKYFDMVIKNFSFHENEGYYILNVYGKEYWDNVNMEAMFNFVVSGQLTDAHTTPIIIYATNTLKRLGIYRNVLMPVYTESPPSS